MNDEKNYQTITMIINRVSETKTFCYCDDQCKSAKLLKNATTFRYRQLFFASRKSFQNLSDHEQSVVDELNTYTANKYGKIEDSKYLPNPEQIQYLYEQSKNPDFYSETLSTQTGRQIINEVYNEFKSFFGGIKGFSKNLTNYTGMPNIPRYAKADAIEVGFTNQDCVLYNINGITYLKMPKMKTDPYKQTKQGKKGYIRLGKLQIDGRLMHVKIVPYYDTYKIALTYKKEPLSFHFDNMRILGIDPGLNNFLTTSNNCGLSPFIIDGRDMKSYNQHYNETLACLRSKLHKGQYTSERIQQLSRKRDCYFQNLFHKMIAYIIDYCKTNYIGKIVFGHNKFQKQNYNKSAVQNQHFCFIPHAKFLNMLKTQCTFVGIQVIETEESYTSKASFLDMDDIPVYGNVTEEPTFSGKRKHRGLYVSKDGTLINADVNGASNIIRKIFPNAFQHIKDFTYLTKSVYKIKIK